MLVYLFLFQLIFLSVNFPFSWEHFYFSLLLMDFSSHSSGLNFYSIPSHKRLSSFPLLLHLFWRDYKNISPCAPVDTGREEKNKKRNPMHLFFWSGRGKQELSFPTQQPYSPLSFLKPSRVKEMHFLYDGRGSLSSVQQNFRN